MKVLFETKDVSRVKLFVQRQFQKICLDRASLQDLTFAREFRGLTGYKPGACIPALELTRRRLRHDRRGAPRTGERVPYVVVHGEPGRPLIQSVRCPSEVLAKWPALRPNAHYYVTKVVAPPLNRCLSLVGADTLQWYAELPKVQRPRVMLMNQDSEGGKSVGGGGGDNILRYFASRHCPACFRLVEGGGGGGGSSLLCRSCSNDPQRTVLELSVRIRRWDRSRRDVSAICRQCAGFSSGNPTCCSLDCPVVYRAVEAHKEAAQIEYVQHNILNKMAEQS